MATVVAVVVVLAGISVAGAVIQAQLNKTREHIAIIHRDLVSAWTLLGEHTKCLQHLHDQLNAEAEAAGRHIHRLDERLDKHQGALNAYLAALTPPPFTRLPLGDQFPILPR